MPYDALPGPKAPPPAPSGPRPYRVGFPAFLVSFGRSFSAAFRLPGWAVFGPVSAGFRPLRAQICLLSGPNRALLGSWWVPAGPCFLVFLGSFPGLRACFLALRARKHLFWALQQGPFGVLFWPCFRPFFGRFPALRVLPSLLALPGPWFLWFWPVFALFRPFSALFRLFRASGPKASNPYRLVTGFWPPFGRVFGFFGLFRSFSALGLRPQILTDWLPGLWALFPVFSAFSPLFGPFWVSPGLWPGTRLPRPLAAWLFPVFRPFRPFLGPFGGLRPPYPCFWLYSKVFWGPLGHFSALFGLSGPPSGRPRKAPSRSILPGPGAPNVPLWPLFRPFWALFSRDPKIRRRSTAFGGSATKRCRTPPDLGAGPQGPQKGPPGGPEARNPLFVHQFAPFWALFRLFKRGPKVRLLQGQARPVPGPQLFSLSRRRRGSRYLYLVQ